MMKRKLCACLCGMALIFNSCAFQAKPEDTIEKLEKAFNNYDVEAVLGCYEPSIQQIYSGIMEIGGALLGGVDLMTLVSMGGGIADLYGDELFEGGLPKLNIDINSQETLSEDRVRMNVTMQYEFSEEMLEQLPENAYAPMTMDVELVFIDGKWYITENAGQSLEDLLLNQGNTNATSEVPAATEEITGEITVTEPPKKMLNIIEAREFHEGLAWVKSDTHWNIVDTNGNIIKKFDDDCSIVTDFKGGYSIINPPTDGQWYEDAQSSCDIQIVNTNGEVILDFVDARYIGLENCAGLDEGSIIVKKNVDEFEKSGDYFFHYDLNTGIEKEICPFREEGESNSFFYAGNGFYKRTLQRDSGGRNFIPEEVLVFHNYMDDTIVSFRDDPIVKEALGDNELESWSCYHVDDHIFTIVKSNDPDIVPEINSCFIIDINNMTCRTNPAIKYCDYHFYLDETYGEGVEFSNQLFYDLEDDRYTFFEPNYDYEYTLQEYQNDLFWVFTENSNGTQFYTFLDWNMNPLFPPKKSVGRTTWCWDYARLDSDYIVTEEEDGSISFLKVSTDSIIKNIPNSSIEYINGFYAWVQINGGNTECYDVETGELLLSLDGTYSVESDFCDGYALVRSDSLKYMNINGETLKIIDQS